MSWGWRLPFLLSVLIFGVGLYIRRHIPESEEFVQASRSKRHAGGGGVPPLSAPVFTAMGLRVAENGGSYIFLAFALAYGKFLGIPNDLMLGGVLASMFVELGTLVWFGHLSDRIGRRAVYLIGAAGLMLVAFPFFWLVQTREPVWIFLAFFLGNTLCHAAMIGTQPAYFAELFPPEVRYTGLALGHELASVFAGGLSPLIAMALLRSTNRPRRSRGSGRHGGHHRGHAAADARTGRQGARVSAGAIKPGAGSRPGIVGVGETPMLRHPEPVAARPACWPGHRPGPGRRRRRAGRGGRPGRGLVQPAAGPRHRPGLAVGPEAELVHAGRDGRRQRHQPAAAGWLALEAGRPALSCWRPAIISPARIFRAWSATTTAARAST